ncbi:unnamed protein product [Rotaria socialis]|uniref:Uncharacterized protein n=1 Tax=Rotaria socialis TaxID=392032 RepID=A0A821J0K2_9BILA|nr:unnamed protein product [Rotaria socialis]CAF4710759.1 unnamed protein product [Rotaria socialis]
MNKIDKTVSSIRYQQLNSLTLSDILFSIDQLEMLLSSCQSLVNFNLTANKISSFENLQRFSQCEYFIHEKLPQLENFSFKITVQMLHYQHIAPSTINSILEKAPDVRIFEVANNGSLRDNPEDECAVLSRQIDHLRIRSPDIAGMKLILERVEHLSTITFMCDSSSPTTWKKIIKWLHEKEKKYSITADYRFLQVFLKQNIGILSRVESLYRIN